MQAVRDLYVRRIDLHTSVSEGPLRSWKEQGIEHLARIDE